GRYRRGALEVHARNLGSRGQVSQSVQSGPVRMGIPLTISSLLLAYAHGVWQPGQRGGGQSGQKPPQPSAVPQLVHCGVHATSVTAVDFVSQPFAFTLML